jgi:hypothetical protein
MYNMSNPTKVVATTEHNLGSYKLNCSYELVTGYVDNSLASVYTVTTEELRDVAEGGKDEEVKDMIKTITKKIEAIEGFGSRTNGGEWNPEGTVWAIGRGRMAINLDEASLQDVVYENHTLTFTVPADKVATVFGADYSANIVSAVEVKIVTKHPENIKNDIIYNLKHGATVVESHGMYTEEKSYMVMSVINIRQIPELYEILRKYPGTFAYYGDVGGVRGNFRWKSTDEVK